MSQAWRFFDDFSDPELARYYEISDGVGEVERTTNGLRYVIARAPDGASSASDRLSIDSLGRPSSPTKTVALRFSGGEWTAEISVTYEFEAKRNGRAAYLWIVNGEPSDRFSRGIAIVRSADLTPESHSLAIVAFDAEGHQRSVTLSTAPGRHHRFRISRSGVRTNVEWSRDNTTFAEVFDAESVGSTTAHSLVFNSSSFAGGAAFVVHSIAVSGAYVRPAPTRMPALRCNGDMLSAESLVDALRDDRDIDVSDCVIQGSLDFAKAGASIAARIHLTRCRFEAALLASELVSFFGSLMCLGCQFRAVGLSNADFTGQTTFVGSIFGGDTRFIDATFRSGVNFSACTFAEKPFFRIARAGGPVSFYHATFAKGADVSTAIFDGDLSLSDLSVESGSLTLHRSQISGTVRLMTTLQRDPQPLGNEVDLSASTLGALVISSGDRANRSEYTGPARWEFPASIMLREATGNALELYNVHVAKVFDLRSSAFKSVHVENASFDHMLGEWPVATEFYSCFISYSSQDGIFADRLHGELRKNGVKCWFAPEDMKIGDRVRQRIDDEIKGHDKLLLILSQHSVRSTWVRDEVEACLERERREHRRILFPIRLDEAVMSTAEAWAANIRRQINIGDFREWNNEDAYRRSLERLLRDLRAH